MTCSETSQLLTAYLDHELGAGERRLLEAHLAGCASCSELLDSLRRASGKLAALTPIEVDAGFRRRVLARIEAERRNKGASRQPSRAPTRWVWGPTLGALGALGAAAAAFLAIARGPREPAELTSPSDLAIASRLELFENYPSVQFFDAIESPEDVAVVAELDQLVPPVTGEGAR